MAVKAQVVKGTKDLLPEQSLKRKYIFNVIEKHFKASGFLPIETPAMEALSTLTGKYGEEGDRLIFKILNSGDFKKGVDAAAYETSSPTELGQRFSEKALRYDLTVPFARFVVNHQNELTFPFKRYQIQPVWRADRPQKGRYREFFQCDADVVGSESLLLEIELIQLYYKVLHELKIPGFIIKINNRKLLSALATKLMADDKLIALTVAIDKLDKIGIDKVADDLLTNGFTSEQVKEVKAYLEISGSIEERLYKLETFFGGIAEAKTGLEELRFIFNHLPHTAVPEASVELDLTLARGLNYYTGAILEVKVPGASVGSICGGGRYNDLTTVFGLANMPGIGISFGADRIYDVLEEFNLFPDYVSAGTQVLFTFLLNESLEHLLIDAENIRNQGFSVEIYPDTAKIKKQLKYANDKSIRMVLIYGEKEMGEGFYAIKDMVSGVQNNVERAEIVKYIAKSLGVQVN